MVSSQEYLNRDLWIASPLPCQ